MADHSHEIDDDEGTMEDEEYREVDPMEVIEDRLMLLEAWLQEDPFHEDVSLKREEYLSLLTELEILGKKMRKTDKLLAIPNQPNRPKLERKRDQYTREVQDIVMYAEQDSFFNLEDQQGEHAEAALNAYMRANSLLGKPLETLAEMTGFEDSMSWNDSQGIGPDWRNNNNKGGGGGTATTTTSASDDGSAGLKPPRGGGSVGTSSSTLDLSKPYNLTILKKKLKKVKQMLEESSTEKERKRLHKKHQEYKAALLEYEAATAAAQGKDKDDDDDDDDDDASSSNASEESMEPLDESPVKKVFRQARQRREMAAIKKQQVELGNSDEEYVMFKKKLSKAMKLLSEAEEDKTSNKKKNATSIQKEKLKRKIQEYVQHLSGFDAWDTEKVQYGFGTADNDDNYHYNNEDQEGHDEEYGMESAAATRFENIAGNFNNELNVENCVELGKKEIKLLRQKLRKVEKMLDETLEREGEEARSTKEFRKLQKKRMEYLTKLGEDQASLSSLSLTGSTVSMDLANSLSQLSLTSVNTADISLSSILSGTANGKSNMQHQQRQAMEPEEIQLIRKKIKKVQKMLKDVAPGSKEYVKLQKKHQQYLAELGEGNTD